MQAHACTQRHTHMQSTVTHKDTDIDTCMHAHKHVQHAHACKHMHAYKQSHLIMYWETTTSLGISGRISNTSSLLGCAPNSNGSLPMQIKFYIIYYDIIAMLILSLSV